MKRLLTLVLVILTAIAGTSAGGQTNTAAISGRVVDPSNALIPGVTITLLDTETRVVTKTVTNESGDYQFSIVKPGKYALRASLSGFAPATVFNISAAAGQALRFNITIEIASPSGNVILIR
jgi:hypothetical protein